MSYCNQQDLIDRFGEAEMIMLTDEEGIQAINPVPVTRAIADVDGMIDSYLAGPFTLPLATVPPVLKKIACHLVRYELYDQAPDYVIDRRDYNIKLLGQISKGQQSLGLNDDGSETTKDAGAVMSTAGHVFGRSDKGFI